jgi:signal transduction histidine kinase
MLLDLPGTSRHDSTDEEMLAGARAGSHIVQFYDSDAALADAVAGFLAAGLRAGEPVLVVATEEHGELFGRRLHALGLDPVEARRRGELTLLDGRGTLDRLMVGDSPDPERFASVIGGAVAACAQGGRGVPVRVYGEMVDLLWRDGNQAGALRLEEMWNQLAATHSFSLLCAYVLDGFYKQSEAAFHRVCGSHSHVLAPKSYAHLQAEIEHRKQVEAALRASVADLRRTEDELRRTVQQRDELIADLSRTVRFSEMFVGILGHDLRNPLSAITTASTHLLRRVGDEKIVRTVGRIVSSSQRMSRMIDQLLDFTHLRLGQGLPLTAQRTDLEEVCRLALEELALPEGGTRVDLQVCGDTVGYWDVDRLGQLASNLIANALRHGTADRPVTVEVDGSDEDRVRLEVANHGMVRPEILSVLFEPFRSTADRKEAHSSGLGLGLYISRHIVLAHGGSIDVKSSQHEGTRFAVVVPRGPHFTGENSESRSHPRGG